MNLQKRVGMSTATLILAVVTSLLSMSFAASAQSPTGNPPAASPPAASPPAASPPAANQAEAIEPEGQKVRVRTSEAKQACRGDITKLCNHPGSAPVGKTECLKTNLTKLSATCRTAFDQQQELQARLRQACRGDLQTLCKEAALTGRAKLLCLQQQAKQVSPDCASVLTKVAASEQGGKRSSGAAPKL